MDLGHKEWILDKFNAVVPLFNGLHKNEETSFLITPPDAKGTISERLLDMVDYIEHSIPTIVENLDESKYI